MSYTKNLYEFYLQRPKNPQTFNYKKIREDQEMQDKCCSIINKCFTCLCSTGIILAPIVFMYMGVCKNNSNMSLCPN